MSMTKLQLKKSPYFGKTEGLVFGSEDFVRQSALEDRFRHCQRNLTTTLGVFFGEVTPVEQFGSSNTKFEAIKYYANMQSLEYPWDEKQFIENSSKRVVKLAIEMSWKLQGTSDTSFDRAVPIYWEKCLQLPIEYFEAEWQETEDTTVYDEDGYDEFGLTREDNEDSQSGFVFFLTHKKD